MESSRVLFVLATIILCIGLSSALSDAELGYFKTGTTTVEYADTGLYPDNSISSCTFTNRGGVASYYHNFEFNGIPWYDYSTMWSFTGISVNHIAEYSVTKCIPKEGSLAATPRTKTSILGFTVAGSYLWHYNTSSNTDAVQLESGTFDTCGGHGSPPPNNAYHVHGWDDWSQIGAGCFEGFDATERDSCPATIVAVALDGFPVYSGQDCSCDPANIQSDGSCSAWPTTPWDSFTSSDLDDCHGRKVDSANPTQSSDVDAEHIYEYRLSLDAPYHIGCLMGDIAMTKKCETCVSTKRADDVMEKIAMKAMKEGAVEHLMELNEILEEAAREVDEEEEKREKEEERKWEEEMEEERRVEKLRSLLKELMNEQ